MSIKNNALQEYNSFRRKIWMLRLTLVAQLVICGLCVTRYSGPIDIVLFVIGLALITAVLKSIKLYEACAARAWMYYQSYTQTIEA